MRFEEVLDQAVVMLQRRGQVTYRTLKRQFDLDDDALEDLKEELLYSHPVVDDEGRGLVWTGNSELAQPSPPAPSKPESVSPPTTEQEREPLSYTPPHLAEKILTSKSALEGERKQVTVLFCDLANSTVIAECLGPENMHTLLNRFFELALEEVHRYEGTINQFLGDGFMALYGAPISHEDHARRAVLSALGLQRTLKKANLGASHGVECKFRIGLNSGLVVVGSIGDNLRMDYSAIGDTTNLASRLQGIAEPGEILVSESTSRLVEGSVRLEALEPVAVKGKTEPVSIYKVVGTLPRRSPIASRGERTLSDFVGRERELAVLEELFEQVESGNGQVVGVVAEAGSGKSRLLYEFRQRLQDKQVTYLEGRCLSYGQTIPYHPIIDIVRNNCGITENDSSGSITQKIRLSLEEIGMDAEESSAYLLQLLGVKEGTESIAQLTPEAVRNRTIETLKEMSLKGSQQQPLIFEIEDLHWIDNTSQDYLATLVESLAGASILLLTTYRPGYQPSWLAKSYATQISLHNLTPQDGLTVVHSSLQGETLPDQVEQMIIDKAEGNPFFLEELTRSMIEQGSSVTDIDVPDTVQGVLMARIDRLPEARKRLLQTASVLGREFSPTVLKAIWEGSDKLEPLLLELKRLEFLFERSGAEEPMYIFKHALTQDVAYESLLMSRRQMLHEAAGQALEDLYADHLEDAYDRLAYHYARTHNAVKAVEYLTLVAGQAAQRYAHMETVAALQEALQHAEQLPDEQKDHRIIDLVTRQAESFHYLGRRREAIDILLPQQVRLERLRDATLRSQYYWSLARNYAFLGERTQVMQIAQRAVVEAQQCDDAAILGQAFTTLAMEEIFVGQLRQAVNHSRENIMRLKRMQAYDQLVLPYFMLVWACCFIGDFAQAHEAEMQCEAMSVITNNRLLSPRCNVAAMSGWGLGLAGEYEAGLEKCQCALEWSPQAYTTAWIMGFLGHVYLEKGDIPKAIDTLEQAVEQAIQYRSRQVQCWFKTFLSEAYCADGQIEKAYDVARQALELAEDIKHPYGIGLAKRVLGHIMYTTDNLAEAATSLREALTIFDAIQAQYYLARTHLNLASLSHTQGNQDTTTNHLSTANAWFKKLQVPKWVEKTEQLAQEYGVMFNEVELEALTEGSS